MSFYPAYLAYIKKVYEKINQTAPIPLEPAFEQLFAQLIFPEKKLAAEEVESILVELKYLYGLVQGLLADDAILQEERNLMKLLATELLPLKNSISPLIREGWLKANLDRKEEQISYEPAKQLLESIGFGEWIKQEFAYYPTRYLFATEQPQQNIVSIVLTKAMQLGVVVEKSWFQTITLLKKYSTHDDLLMLSYHNWDLFQALDLKYPGFLAHMVTSLDDLMQFCQALPMTFQRLLNAPQVQPFRADILDYVSILEQLYLPMRIKQALAQSAIKNVDDLIRVVNAYPNYVVLLVVSDTDALTKLKTYAEGPCGHLLKKRADLVRFDLSYHFLQTTILQLPRYRALVGKSTNFIMRSADAVLPKRSVLVQRNGLFRDVASRLALSVPDRIDSRLLTLGQANYAMQFNESAGYYCNDNIVFSSFNQKGHFATEATEGYCLAIALGYQAYELWLKAPAAHKACFELLECGAGEGDLCLKILNFISVKGEDNPRWQQFYQALHYTIVELSPVLVKRQTEKLKALKSQGKVDIMQGNAVKMQENSKKYSFVISNELLDMLPSEEIKIGEPPLTGRSVHDAEFPVIPPMNIQVSMLVPVLTPAAYIFLAASHPQAVEGLDEEAKSFSKLLQLHQLTIDHQGIVLTADRFKQLVAITAKQGFAGPEHCFLFSKGWLPLSYFPDLARYLADHAEILVGMHTGDIKIISTAMDAFARFVAKNALASVSVDYGNLTHLLKGSGYRGYGVQDNHHKFNTYLSPGKRDITFDVDFTAAAKSIKQHSPQSKVRVVKMGDLLPPSDFKLPESYKALCSADNIENFRMDKYFFALLSTAPGIEGLMDTHLEEILPLTQHQLFRTVVEIAKESVHQNQAKPGIY